MSDKSFITRLHTMVLFTDLPASDINVLEVLGKNRFITGQCKFTTN